MEYQLSELQLQKTALAVEAKELLAKANSKDRQLSDGEKREFGRLLKEMEKAELRILKAERPIHGAAAAETPTVLMSTAKISAIGRHTRHAHVDLTNALRRMHAATASLKRKQGTPGLSFSRSSWCNGPNRWSKCIKRQMPLTLQGEFTVKS